MSRRPNFWVTVPIAVAALAGGVIGYFVTDASCAPESCTFAAVSGSHDNSSGKPGRHRASTTMGRSQSWSRLTAVSQA